MDYLSVFIEMLQAKILPLIQSAAIRLTSNCILPILRLLAFLWKMFRGTWSGIP